VVGKTGVWTKEREKKGKEKEKKVKEKELGNRNIQRARWEGRPTARSAMRESKSPRRRWRKGATEKVVMETSKREGMRTLPPSEPQGSCP
jgi:hypothetical protein